VRAHTAFAYDTPAQVPQTPGPTAAELALLRGPVAKVIAENYPEFARRVWRTERSAQVHAGNP
jgi:glutaconate CoA-transferase subunit B